MRTFLFRLHPAVRVGSLALLLAAMLVFAADDALADHTMPGVVGLAEADATAQLEGLGLQVRIVTIAGTTAGRVAAQSPAQGAPVADGDEVELRVGVAIDIQTVAPRVVGMSERRVIQALEAAYVLEIQHVPGPAHLHGRVISQAPAAGAAIPFRGIFRVQIVQNRITLPLVVGRTEAGARQLLTDVGLGMQVRYVPSRFAPAGTVISQDPRAGAAMLPGDVVDVVVAGRRPSGGGAHALVPHVVGLAMHEAEERILASGLVPHVHLVTAAGQPDWSVVRQEVPAGRRVEEGAPVGIDVAKPARTGGGVRTPSLYGLLRDEALDLLGHMGLAAAFTSQPSLLPPDTIIGQAQRPGMIVPAGSILRLVVAATAPRGWRPPVTLVPDVSGMRAAEAHIRLLMAGFRPRMRREIGAGQPIDRVFRQDPAAGLRKNVGERVLYVLPYRATVPNLLGKTRTQATAALVAAGLQGLAQRSGPAVTGGVSKVVWQQNAAGEEIARGSLVPYRYVMRRPAVPLVAVPNVIGLTKELAATRITAAGFRAVLRADMFGAGRTQVVSQSPVAGALRPRGHTVEASYRYVVGGLHPFVAVPRVLGLSEAAARAQLVARGLAVRVVRTAVPGPASTSVVGQDPVAGSRVARGTAVTITVRVAVGPGPLVRVPSVVGKRVDKALRTLRDAGFRVTTSGIGTRVRSQNPAAGTLKPRGSRVKIKLRF